MVTVTDGILKSRLLNKDLPYRVVLPANYQKTKHKYPVLYLLHGLFGSFQNWTVLTDLALYAENYDFIIVTPEGEDGWFVDSAGVSQNKFESYLINELIPEIEALFQIKKNRGSRAIAGLSMGGYGALKFGLKYSDSFIFAGSMSGAFDAPRQTDRNPGCDWENLKPSIWQAFGKEGNAVRIENDLFRIIPPIVKKEILPHLYLDCGNKDAFLPVNLELHNLLIKNHIPHDYFISPGGHDWDYWDRRIKEVLKIVAGCFL